MKDFLFKVLDLDSSTFDKMKTEIGMFKNSVISEPGRFTIVDKESTLNSLPTIVKWLEDNNLVVRQIAYISIGANTIQQAHIDSGDLELALNFPVLNCDDVTTEFFEYEEQDFTIQYTIGTKLPFHHFNCEDKTSIGSFSLTQPTLLNIKMPHRIVNSTDLERISLSFRFEKDPWHLA
jgi:hypothetical protein